MSTTAAALFPFLQVRPGRRRRPAVKVPAVVPFRPAAPVRTQPGGRAAAGRSAGRWVRSTYRGPAGARSYEVYLPAGHRRATRVPLVVLLHGCDQTARDFVATTRFTALADRHGFLLVAPSQSRAAQPGGCWRWFDAHHQRRGAGEPAILAGITAAVLAEPVRWRVDPARVYAAGLSAGAAMALVLGAAYPEVFAAVGVHSGPAWGSAASGRRALTAMTGRAGIPPPAGGGGIAPLVVVQGVADPVVHERAGRQVVDQWLAHDAARAAADPRARPVTRSRSTAKRSTDGRSYTVSSWYTARGRKQLEYWRVDGLAHAWSGGVRGASYSDPGGPRASTAMWRFFAAHTR